MTAAEKIQDLIADVEDEARKDTINDILTDLREYLKGCGAEERAGLEAAIEVIDLNYDH